MSHQLEDVPGFEGCAHCTTCGGFEGSLPSECPGEPMGTLVRQRVYAGVMDFRGGRWIQPRTPGLVIRMHEHMPFANVPLSAVDRWGSGSKKAS